MCVVDCVWLISGKNVLYLGFIYLLYLMNTYDFFLFKKIEASCSRFHMFCT